MADIENSSGPENVKSERSQFKSKSNAKQLMIHINSLRDIQYSIQMTCSFVFSVLIIYFSAYGGTLDSTGNQWLTAVTGTVLIMDTVGMTLLSILIALLNFIPECIYMYILQNQGMGYQDYMSTTLFFVLIMFCIGFVNPQIKFRRIALFLPSILFTVLVTTPSQYIPSDLVWIVLKQAMVGLAVALAVSIVILPRYACIELQDRFTYTLALTAEACEAITTAMLSTRKTISTGLLLEAEGIMDNLKSNQSIMNERTPQSTLEPRPIIRKMYRGKQVVFNKYSTKELNQISCSLIWHMMSMLHTVHNLHFNDVHAQFVSECRDAFLDTLDKLHTVVDLLTNRELILYGWFGYRYIHDTVAIDEALVSLKKSSNYSVFILCHALLKTNGSSGHLVHSKNHETNLNKKSPSLPTGVDDFPNEIGSENVSDLSPLLQQSTHSTPKLVFDKDASTTNNNTAMSTFLFHLSEILRLLEAKFYTKKEDTAADEEASGNKGTQTKESTEITKTNDNHNNKKKKSKLKEFCHRKALTYTINGLKTVLFMGVAFIVAVEPTLSKKFEHGTWILFAVIQSQGDNLGLFTYYKYS